MEKLRYTYLAKGKYWRFRHASVGDFAILGKPGSHEFMARYGALLAKICGKPEKKSTPAAVATPVQIEKGAWVYFVQSADGPIKIGFTANLKKRMSNLKTGHPASLNLIAQFPGTRMLEKMIHAELWEHRLDGEWFAPVPAVKEVIDMLKEAMEP